MGRGERSKKKRRFRSLSPAGRSGTPGGRGTPDAGYGGGGSLTEQERANWRCVHCRIWGTSVWAVRNGPLGPRVRDPVPPSMRVRRMLTFHGSLFVPTAAVSTSRPRRSPGGCGTCMPWTSICHKGRALPHDSNPFSVDTRWRCRIKAFRMDSRDIPCGYVCVGPVYLGDGVIAGQTGAPSFDTVVQAQEESASGEAREHEEQGRRRRPHDGRKEARLYSKRPRMAWLASSVGPSRAIGCRPANGPFEVAWARPTFV